MSFNEASFEKKLKGLNQTLESIQTLSLWCLHHRESHVKIVSTWTKLYRAAQSKQRLTLFYLANDIVQLAKKKKQDQIRKSFLPALKEAILLARNDTTRSSIERTLHVWRERGIFDSEQLEQLWNIFKPPKRPPVEKPPKEVTEKFLENFRTETLVGELERFQSLERSIERAKTLLPGLNFEVGENLKTHLKDRQQGLQIVSEIEDTLKKLQEFVLELGKHLQQRKNLLTLLEQAELFYDTQLAEAGIVEKAYRTFGDRIAQVKAQLDELRPTLPSSPPKDAPSPTPFEDPFSEGVEAAIGAARKPGESGEAAMELEGEETGVSILLNQSFLPQGTAQGLSGGAEGQSATLSPSSHARLMLATSASGGTPIFDEYSTAAASSAQSSTAETGTDLYRAVSMVAASAGMPPSHSENGIPAPPSSSSTYNNPLDFLGQLMAKTSAASGSAPIVVDLTDPSSSIPSYPPPQAGMNGLGVHPSYPPLTPITPSASTFNPFSSPPPGVYPAGRLGSSGFNPPPPPPLPSPGGSYPPPPYMQAPPGMHPNHLYGQPPPPPPSAPTVIPPPSNFPPRPPPLAINSTPVVIPPPSFSVHPGRGGYHPQPHRFPPPQHSSAHHPPTPSASGSHHSTIVSTGGYQFGPPSASAANTSGGYSSSSIVSHGYAGGGGGSNSLYSFASPSNHNGSAGASGGDSYNVVSVSSHSATAAGGPDEMGECMSRGPGANSCNLTVLGGSPRSHTRPATSSPSWGSYSGSGGGKLSRDPVGQATSPRGSDRGNPMPPSSHGGEGRLNSNYFYDDFGMGGGALDDSLIDDEDAFNALPIRQGPYPHHGYRQINPPAPNGPRISLLSEVETDDPGLELEEPSLVGNYRKASPSDDPHPAGAGPPTSGPLATPHGAAPMQSRRVSSNPMASGNGVSITRPMEARSIFKHRHTSSRGGDGGGRSNSRSSGGQLLDESISTNNHGNFVGNVGGESSLFENASDAAPFGGNPDPLYEDYYANEGGAPAPYLPPPTTGNSGGFAHGRGGGRGRGGRGNWSYQRGGQRSQISQGGFQKNW